MIAGQGLEWEKVSDGSRKDRDGVRTGGKRRTQEMECWKMECRMMEG
jgi:hypothetical protein